MENSQQLAKRLLAGIQQDHKHYNQLMVLLSEQRTLIIERQTDRLNELNQEVEGLYKDLNGSTSERMSLLKRLNIPTDANGMRFFLSHLPTQVQAKASSLWDDLELRVNDCQQLNQYNTQIMTMQQEIFNSLLGNQADLIYQR